MTERDKDFLATTVQSLRLHTVAAVSLAKRNQFIEGAFRINIHLTGPPGTLPQSDFVSRCQPFSRDLAVFAWDYGRSLSPNMDPSSRWWLVHKLIFESGIKYI